MTNANTIELNHFARLKAFEDHSRRYYAALRDPDCATTQAEIGELAKAMDQLAWLTGFECYALDWKADDYLEDVATNTGHMWSKYAEHGERYAAELEELIGRPIVPDDAQQARWEVDHGLDIGRMFPRAPSIADVVPWIHAAMLQHSLWLRWWNYNNGGGGGEYTANRDVMRYGTPPDFIEYNGESVTACWYVDGLGTKYRGPRDISRLEFYPTGHVVLIDTNIVFPEQWAKMSASQ